MHFIADKLAFIQDWRHERSNCAKPLITCPTQHRISFLHLTQRQAWAIVSSFCVSAKVEHSCSGQDSSKISGHAHENPMATKLSHPQKCNLQKHSTDFWKCMAELMALNFSFLMQIGQLSGKIHVHAERPFRIKMDDSLARGKYAYLILNPCHQKRWAPSQCTLATMEKISSLHQRLVFWQDFSWKLLSMEHPKTPKALPNTDVFALSPAWHVVRLRAGFEWTVERSGIQYFFFLQWNLVCDKDGFAETSQTVMVVGVMVSPELNKIRQKQNHCKRNPKTWDECWHLPLFCRLERWASPCCRTCLAGSRFSSSQSGPWSLWASAQLSSPTSTSSAFWGSSPALCNRFASMWRSVN